MKNSVNNESTTKTFTEKFINMIGKILVTPYNLSLVFFTILWEYISSGRYWNTNFDMTSAIENQILYLGLLSILIGSISNKEQSKHLMRLGVITTFMVVFCLTTSKAVATMLIGGLLKPITMFCFFLILKNIWLISFNITEPKEI